MALARTKSLTKRSAPFLQKNIVDYQTNVRIVYKKGEKMEIQEILDLIKNKRHALGLSQFDLSKQCGISRQNIIEIEKGKRIPKLTTLLQILRALNLKTKIK